MRVYETLFLNILEELSIEPMEKIPKKNHGKGLPIEFLEEPGGSYSGGITDNPGGIVERAPEEIPVGMSEKYSLQITGESFFKNPIDLLGKFSKDILGKLSIEFLNELLKQLSKKIQERFPKEFL